MGKLAFVFPGQGSQWVGMGKELAERYPEARAVFDAADDAFLGKLSSLCFAGPEESLRLTTNTQPAILTVSMAIHVVLGSRLPAPDYLAGHSLGEFSALTAAGALPLTSAVKLVRERGRLMQEAVAEGVGAMAAVLGATPEQVEQACREAAAELAAQGSPGLIVQPANYNEPSQTVISGHAQAVARAGERATALGAKKVVPLAVSAPFHCALMSKVEAPLREELGDIELSAPSAPVFSNVDAAPNADAARIPELLVRQVTSPVRWTETISALRALGVDRFVEVGPGRVLSGMIKRIDRAAAVFQVEDPASLEKTLTALSA